MLKTLLAHFASGAALVAMDQKAVFQANLESMAADPRAAELAGRIDADADADDGDDGFWPDDEDSFLAWCRPYKVKDGILHIPVMGVLLNRFPYAFGSYATGYDYIRRAFDRGMDDANVQGIAFVEDSPGGMVAGCFELCDHIESRRGEKPIKSFAADHAYSAAYAIASQADTISVTRSGGVGSVGVVTSHVDWSGAMEQAGIKVTFIHAGAHKVDGNPYEALSKDAKDRIQARIDKLYGVFVSTVARGRDMDESAVRKTEALCYDAEEAIEVGFADKIESADDGLKDYAASLKIGDDQMTQKQDTSGKPAAGGDEAAVNAARAEGVTEGKAEGAKAERERIAAILTCANAEGREAAAIELALDTDTAFSATTADKILGKMPKASAAKSDEKKGGDEDEDENGKGGKKDKASTGSDHFSAHMDKNGSPEVGKGGGQEDNAAKTDDEKDTDALMGAYGQAGGLKPKTAK